MSQQPLAGRIALVTGGAQGQGEAHVRRLAQDGAKVYFGDVNEAVGQATAAKLTEAGLNVTFRRMDVTSAEAWQSVLKIIDAEHDRLDILVNNAGVLDMLGPEEATEESWQFTIDVNQKGVFLGTKYAAPLLRKSRHPSVINTSSIFALIAAPNYFAYTASKGAVAAMTKAAAMTYGKDGIRFNSVHPGYIDTPMLRREFEILGPEAESATLAAIPLGRLAGPDDVANTVAFLASDESSYITGAELIVDGGVLAS